jgi:hypothetical protein
MERESLIGYAALVIGFVALAVVLFGLSALAADQPTATPIGPIMESGKDLSDQGLSMQRIDPKTGELTKEMEKPMQVPEVRDDSKPLGYRPLCGPAKNAINHYACGEGYDHLAF